MGTLRLNVLSAGIGCLTIETWRRFRFPWMVSMGHKTRSSCRLPSIFIPHASNYLVDYLIADLTDYQIDHHINRHLKPLANTSLSNSKHPVHDAIDRRRTSPKRQRWEHKNGTTTRPSNEFSQSDTTCCRYSQKDVKIYTKSR